MKRRKNLVLALLLVASLVLGIGYAAYTTTLTINGTAGVSAEALEFTEDVVFTAASSNNTAFGTAAFSGDTATFETRGMTRAQERVQFTYTITNNSDFDVNIDITTTPTTSNGASKFSVTTALGAHTIPAGGSISATVTVVLNETVEEPVEDTAYVIRYTATSVE